MITMDREQLVRTESHQRTRRRGDESHIHTSDKVESYQHSEVQHSAESNRIIVGINASTQSSQTIESRSGADRSIDTVNMRNNNIINSTNRDANDRVKDDTLIGDASSSLTSPLLSPSSSSPSPSASLLPLPPPLFLFSYRITGMDCSGCSTMAADRIRSVSGVRDVTISIMTGIGEVTYQQEEGKRGTKTINDDKEEEEEDRMLTSHAIDVGMDVDHTSTMNAVSSILINAITTVGFNAFLRFQRVVDVNASSSLDAASAAAPVVMVTCTIGISAEQQIDEDDIDTMKQTLKDTVGVESVQTVTNQQAGISTTKKTKRVDANSSSPLPLHTLVTVSYDPSLIGARTLLSLVSSSSSSCSSSRVVSSLDASSFMSAAAAVGGSSATEWSMVDLWRYRFILCSIFALPILLITFILPALFNDDSTTMLHLHYLVYRGLTVSTLVSWILATPIQILGGAPLYISAWRVGYYAHTVNIDTLVMMSTTVAYGYSAGTTIATMSGGEQGEGDVFFDTSALLLTIIIFGRYLEAVAKGAAATAISDLARMQVDTAMIREDMIDAKANKDTNDGAVSSSSSSSSFVSIPIDLLHRDDILAVYPGDRIPTDGEVVFGSTDVDESMMTGEGRPVKKMVGDIVLGSTINKNGMIHMRVTKVNGENALAGIMQLVQDAQGSSPPIQRVADRVATFFVPVIIVMSVAVFIIWYALALYGIVHTTMRPFAFALQFAIAVLVVSCPCAVGLAVPTAVMVSSGIGARIGVIFKNGPALEAMSQLNTICLDKTGTITEGRPTVTEWKRIKDDDTNNATDATMNDERFWHLVGSAESSSEHVLATSMREYALKRINDASSSSSSSSSLLVPPPPRRLVTPSDFSSVPGRGIKCTIVEEEAEETATVAEEEGEGETNKKGVVVLIGNIEWMKENEVIISTKIRLSGTAVAPSSVVASSSASTSSSSSSCCSKTTSSCKPAPVVAPSVAPAASSCCSSKKASSCSSRAVITPIIVVDDANTNRCSSSTKSTSTSSSSSSSSPSSADPASSSCCSSTPTSSSIDSPSCSSSIVPIDADSSLLPSSCSSSSSSSPPSPSKSCSKRSCSTRDSIVAPAASSCCSAKIVVASVDNVDSSASPATSLCNSKPKDEGEEKKQKTTSCCSSTSVKSSSSSSDTVVVEPKSSCCSTKAVSTTAPLSPVASSSTQKSSCCSTVGGESKTSKCNSSGETDTNTSTIVVAPSSGCCSTIAPAAVTSSCSTGKSSSSSSCCPPAAPSSSSCCPPSSSGSTPSTCSSSPSASTLAWSTLSSSVFSPLESSGSTVVCVAIDGRLAGWISLSDAIRSDAREVVQAIQAMGINVWIMSGDNSKATKAAAREVGIDEDRAIGECMPADKVKWVRSLQSANAVDATVTAAVTTPSPSSPPVRCYVAFAGDGINDAAVIAVADVGIAVMRGSDVAIACADVLLMTDDLFTLIDGIRLAQSTFATIRMNLSWAFIYNACAIPIAVGCFYTVFGRALPPTFAGLAELLSSMPVILCSIALRRFRAKGRNQGEGK